MNNHIFRKVLVFSIILLFIGAGIVVSSSNKINISRKNFCDTTLNHDYTHTVFVGIGTSQNCEPCHTWNQYIHEIYASGNYDFEYVEMIEFDHEGRILNQKANDWSHNHSIGAYPTSIFDGGHQRIIGDKPEKLTNALNESGIRNVANIAANITLMWLGNTKIQVDVTIKNNEGVQYDGHIRAFITEIVSRYDTKEGDPYNFGFLDYAFNKDVLIAAGGEYVDSVVWDGNEHEDEHGNDFGDITKNNTQVTLVIYNSDDGYVDVTTMDRIGNSPPNIPTIDGPTTGNPQASYNYTFSAIDPDGDNVTICIDFGDDTGAVCYGPIQYGEDLVVAHTWDEKDTYIITAYATDIYGAESLEGALEVSIPINKPFLYSYSILSWLFERFPNMFPILRQVMGL